MNIKSFIKDDDAVSPVIGVILMVAITVILAAVIGAFVLGIGGDQSVAPQASWSIDESTTQVDFVHQGGDSIEGDTLSITLGSNTDEATDLGIDGSTISAGDVVTADDSSNLATSDFDDGNEVRLTWEDPSSDDTSVLRTHEMSNQ